MCKNRVTFTGASRVQHRSYWEDSSGCGNVGSTDISGSTTVIFLVILVT